MCGIRKGDWQAVKEDGMNKKKGSGIYVNMKTG